jgi:hypothetical protein
MLLGVGRAHVQQFSRDDFGRLDIDAMQRALEDLDGQPALVLLTRVKSTLASLIRSKI